MPTKRKPTQEEIDEALNPSLSDTIIRVGDQDVQVKAISSRKEQILLSAISKSLKAEGLAQTLDAGPNMMGGVMSVIENVPVDKIADIAAMIMHFQGYEDVTADYLLDNVRVVDQVELIIAQVQKQRYLDFLFRMMGVLNLSLGKQH